MAEIRPFQGLRYDPNVVGNLGAVMAPPYDVIDAAGQSALYNRHPHNIVRIELGQQFPSDSASDNRYTRAASYLEGYVRDGILKREPEPALYVYQQSIPFRGKRITRTGFLAAMRLEEWRKGIVLPHEATMSGPKLDRLQLMRAAAINCSPIFTLYRDPSGIAKQALAEASAGGPAISIVEGDEEHRLWVVTDPRLTAVLAQVVAAHPVYIADGHHRYETALFYRDEQRAIQPGYTGDEPWNFVMSLMVAVDDPGLVVLPTHRLANPRGESGGSATLAEDFVVEPLGAAGDRATQLREVIERLASGARSDAERHVFAVYGGQDAERYGLEPRTFGLLTARPEQLGEAMPEGRAATWRSLDVSVLHEVLLRRVLGLSEAEFENERYVTYTRDEVSAVEAVDAGTFRLAILLNPTRVEQVLAIAEAGEVMPHKSTYFHPKPLTGLVINQLA